MPDDTDDPQRAKTKELTLLLALAFNDLKMLAWQTDQMEKCRPQPGVTPEAGQWSGMVIWIDRMAAGMLRELVRLLQYYESQGCSCSSGMLVEASRRAASANPSAGAAWNHLVEIARARDPREGEAPSAAGSRLRGYLRAVRDGVAFHYRFGGKTILDGYRRHFAEGEGDPARQCAYVSLGPSMEQSRFYFADGAAQQALAAAREQFELGFGGPIRDFARSVNTALRFVVGFLLVELRDTRV